MGALCEPHQEMAHRMHILPGLKSGIWLLSSQRTIVESEGSVISLCAQEKEEVCLGQEWAASAIGTNPELEAVGHFWLVPVSKSVVGTRIRPEGSLCYLNLHKTR